MRSEHNYVLLGKVKSLFRVQFHEFQTLTKTSRESSNRAVPVPSSQNEANDENKNDGALNKISSRRLSLMERSFKGKDTRFQRCGRPQLLSASADANVECEGGFFISPTLTFRHRCISNPKVLLFISIEGDCKSSSLWSFWYGHGLRDSNI